MLGIAAGRFALTCPSIYSPKETYDAFNVNVFGVLNVTRAVLPVMRARRRGLVVTQLKVNSFITTLATLGIATGIADIIANDVDLANIPTRPHDRRST